MNLTTYLNEENIIKFLEEKFSLVDEEGIFFSFTLKVEKVFSFISKIGSFLEPYFSEEKFYSELPQYKSYIVEIEALIKRLDYFFKENYGRKIVVAKPLECISLIQIGKSLVGSYIRSSDLELFPLDLFFIFSLGKVFNLVPPIIYNINVNFLHKGNRDFPNRTPISYEQVLEEIFLCRI